MIVIHFLRQQIEWGNWFGNVVAGVVIAPVTFLAGVIAGKRQIPKVKAWHKAALNEHRAAIHEDHKALLAEHRTLIDKDHRAALADHRQAVNAAARRRAK